MGAYKTLLVNFILAVGNFGTIEVDVFRPPTAGAFARGISAVAQPKLISLPIPPISSFLFECECSLRYNGLVVA